MKREKKWERRATLLSHALAMIIHMNTLGTGLLTVGYWNANDVHNKPRFSLYSFVFSICARIILLFFSLIQLILIFDFIGMREMFVRPIMTMICEILRFICASMLSCVHIDDGWCWSQKSTFSSTIRMRIAYRLPTWIFLRWLTNSKTPFKRDLRNLTE